MANPYDFKIDVERLDLAPALIYHLVGTGKRVLDVGGATGNLGRLLTEAGNDVTVVDNDAASVEKAAVGNSRAIRVDIENTPLAVAIPGEKFDVVVLADVLEHVRDPLTILHGMRAMLAPEAVAILSVPNVAHADVRLALLEGRWEYAESGLLDRTHLRWFTLTSLIELIEMAGFHLTAMERVRRPMFETAIGVGAHSSRLLDLLRSDPESETYQFVVVIQHGDPRAEMAELTLPRPLYTSVLDHEFAALTNARDAALAESDALRAALDNTSIPRRVRRIPRRIAAELRGFRSS